MRTVVEHASHTITLDNGRYSSRHPKPAGFVEVPEWDSVNGQRVEIVPPVGQNESPAAVQVALGETAARLGVNLVDLRQVPPGEGCPQGATLLLADPDRGLPMPVPTLLAFGKQAVDMFSQQG